MATRTSGPRLLSRSGQPRRRLARRRQQLPDPVMHGHGMHDVLTADEPVILAEVLAESRPAELIDTLLVDSTAEIETDSIVSI